MDVGIIHYVVWTNLFEYGRVRDRSDARALARRVKRRYPESTVYMAEVSVNGGPPYQTWTIN